MLTALQCMSVSRALEQPALCCTVRDRSWVCSADIMPDRFTYNALLEAHTAAEDLEGVARVYQTMLTRGIRPDICTFVALFQVSLPSSYGSQGIGHVTARQGAAHALVT